MSTPAGCANLGRVEKSARAHVLRAKGCGEQGQQRAPRRQVRRFGAPPVQPSESIYLHDINAHPAASHCGLASYQGGTVRSEPSMPPLPVCASTHVHDARVDVAELLEGEEAGAVGRVLEGVRRGRVDGDGGGAGGRVRLLAGMLAAEFKRPSLRGAMEGSGGGWDHGS